MDLPSARQPALGSPRRQWPLFFSVLVLFAVIDTLHDYIGHRAGANATGILQEIRAGLFYWVPCLAFVPLIVALARRYPLNLQRPASIGLHAACALLFVYVHIMILSLHTLPFMNPALDYWGRFFYSLPFIFALDYCFYTVIVASVCMLRQYEHLKEGEVRASQLEARLAEARLRALEAQLNPHFFFNTLQAISVLAMIGQRDRVVETLAGLSNLLRVSFDKHRPPQLSLAEEMEFLDGYLAIQQLCFGSRLTVLNEVQQETLVAIVPTMLLQPLVENAIIHGVAIKPGAGIIRITSRRSDDELLLEVADNGPGFQTTEPQGDGLGLAATESRLKLLFDSRYSLEYGRSELGGASVRVTMPFTVSAPSGLQLAGREKAA